MSDENEDKKIALEHLKAHYEEFYNLYCATEPSKVSRIQYFLDWLNEKATPDDIEVEKIDSYIRRCELNVNVEYFFSYGDTYSNFYHTTGVVSGLVCDNSEFTGYFNDVYFSLEANKSKIVPGCIKELAEKEARKLFYKTNSQSDAIYSGAQITGHNISEPQPNPFLSCRVKYPHPIPDKSGDNIRFFKFIIWNDKYYTYSDSVGPWGADEGRNEGCYIATAVYGSYDCPEVWTLRRYRDETLGASWYGRAFISIYYAISPTLVRIFGNTEWFKKIWREKLNKMVQNLNKKGVSNIPYEDVNWKK